MLFEEAKIIAREFSAKYMSECLPINFVGVSIVSLFWKGCPESCKDDYCISVGLRYPLFADQYIPMTFKGLHVFTEVVGEIVAL